MAVVVANQATDSQPISTNINKLRYGKVILLLENCILPPEKLSSTPSMLDGLDIESEIDLRILGCELIQTSGILLKLPQVAMATGQVLFQRFFYSKSFVRHAMEIVAMACVTLASKIEESPRRIRDVINVFHHIKQVRAGKTIQPLILDQNYINTKNQVIKAERRVLKELGFCVHVKHPHKIIVTLLQVLECEKNQKLIQTAWNYMNDSLRSDVFLRHQPEAIACACIYLSARLLRIALPKQPSWFLVFGVNEEEINEICLNILKLYVRKKPDAEKLEKEVEELKKVHSEAKLKAKGLLGNALSSNNTGFSPSSQPTSPKKSPNLDSKKENGSSAASPRRDKDQNHVNSHKRKGHSNRASPMAHKRSGSSSEGARDSRSPSPKKKKTPPRGYKDPLKSRSHDGGERKESKRHRTSSHKRKRSRSRMRNERSSRSPHRHSSSSRKYYKERERSRR